MLAVHTDHSENTSYLFGQLAPLRARLHRAGKYAPHRRLARLLGLGPEGVSAGDHGAAGTEKGSLYADAASSPHRRVGETVVARYPPRRGGTPQHLPYYLDEYTFRFNRRKSKSRGKLFFRLMQQAAATSPQTYDTLVGRTKSSQQAAQQVGVG